MNTIEMLETLAHSDRCLAFRDDFIKRAETFYSDYMDTESAQFDARFLWGYYVQCQYNIVGVYQLCIMDDITRAVITKLVESCKPKG